MLPLVRPLLALAAVALLQSCAAQFTTAAPSPDIHCSNIKLGTLKKAPSMHKVVVTYSLPIPNKDDKINPKSPDNILLVPQDPVFGKLKYVDATICNKNGTAPFVVANGGGPFSAEVHCSFKDGNNRCPHGVEVRLVQQYEAYTPTTN